MRQKSRKRHAYQQSRDPVSIAEPVAAAWVNIDVNTLVQGIACTKTSIQHISKLNGRAQDVAEIRRDPELIEITTMWSENADGPQC